MDVTRIFSLLFGLIASTTVMAQNFLPVAEAFQSVAEKAENWTVSLSSADGYYLYEDKTRVWVDDGFAAAPIAFSAPAGEDFPDPLFGSVPVWHGDAKLVLDDLPAGELWVEFQGCSEDGFCYPPEKRLLTVISD